MSDVIERQEDVTFVGLHPGMSIWETGNLIAEHFSTKLYQRFFSLIELIADASDKDWNYDETLADVIKQVGALTREEAVELSEILKKLNLKIS